MDRASVEIATLLQSGFRYALSLTHDTHQAEDVLQDAWMAVIRANGPLSKPYLFSAVRSRFLNANRREKLYPVVSLEDLGELGEDDSADEGGAGLDGELLERAIADLRCVEREVLFLMVVEGYTAQEVADLTQRPRGTVLSMLHRGKKKVRRYFKQQNARTMP
ncbi:hypothetical protein MNBD_GAMMA26-504 [hydrothermal vent metagenome]|uniref:RNA polymerase ECF-type sigma factor n=1 Tax=hydrothermal vent metagenome TaxID=652676 RepID=A0A3B1BJK1_9ZZZZ